LQSTLPKGVSVSYEPKEGIFETSVVTISVSSDAPAGAYQIVLSAMLSTKKKGEIVKLTVGIEYNALIGKIDLWLPQTFRR
jgi:hypothetical protein